MKAIKKIMNVKNNSLFLEGLSSINNQKVEVIIIPIPGQKTRSGKNNLQEFNGAGQSSFTDTSVNVDSIIYGS